MRREGLVIAFRLSCIVVIGTCLVACGSAKKAETADDASAADGNADAAAEIAADVTDLTDLGGDDVDPGTDVDDSDTDQPITDATLLDIPDGCQKSCKYTATGLPKVCGPDGCGSVCGFCGSGKICAPDQLKCNEPCVKQCTTLQGKTKMCGDDGCGYGGQCGVCDAGFNCVG